MTKQIHILERIGAIYPEDILITEDLESNMRFTLSSNIIKNDGGNYYLIPIKSRMEVSKSLFETQPLETLVVKPLKRSLYEEALKDHEIEHTHYILNSNIREYLEHLNFKKKGYWYIKDYNDFISDVYATKIKVNYINQDNTLIICFDAAGIDDEVIFRGNIKTIDELQVIFKMLMINE